VDVASIRARTAGANHQAFFDNAGSSLLSDGVVATMLSQLRAEQRWGGYRAAEMATDRLDGVYRSIARLIGCASDEVALLDSATRAWQAAFHAVPLRPMQRILTSRSEYPSNALGFLTRVRREGVRVGVVPDDDSGVMCIKALERELERGDVGLVAVTHVPTYNGLVNPIRAIGALTRAADVLLLVDACQSVGQLSVDVRALQCDLLSGTGRKFLRGPRGTGFLYVRQAIADRLMPPSPDLRAATWTGAETFELSAGARRFECWERNVVAQLGLGAAVDEAVELGVGAIEKRTALLAQSLRSKLRSVAGVRLWDRGHAPSAIVTFSVDEASAERVVARCRAADVVVDVTYPSRAHYDVEPGRPGTLVRASVHYFNTESELDRLVKVVSEP